MRYTTLVLAALVLLAARPAQAQQYVVVVNPGSSVSSLSKSEVSEIFLKKNTKLVAVDQSKGAAVRDAFSKAVHGKPAAAVASYWQQQIFSGRDVPPAEKGSDAEVIAFVKSTPNAIGYVSAGAALDGVKKVSVQ